MKDKVEYIAFIHKEDNEYVSVVPDLNYVSIFANTFKEIVHNIVEACELYCEDLKILSKSSSLEDLLKRSDIEKDATPQLIDIKVEKLKRINVMMRAHYESSTVILN